MYKSIIRPLLYLFQPETIHHVVFGTLKWSMKLPFVSSISRSLFVYEHPSLEKNLFGLKFKSPVGLAAGFDKEASHIDELANLGFGFIEIGTLTPKGQPGNPKPRIFRVVEDEGLINRMGFNNEGVEAAVKHLKARKGNVIVGGNIGKNKVTPNEEAVNDYIQCFNALFDHVDYFTVNVSSPNTPNLRELQDKEPLTQLLGTLQALNEKKGTPKPIFLKIAPDLTDSQLDDIIEIVADTKIEGVIATNTTISREGLKTDTNKVTEIGAGGLSGKPVKSRSTEVIRYLNQKSNGKLQIIGVGGIYTAEDAIEKIEAGASLVQVYTGFVYEGPSIVKNINKGLVKYYQTKA
ncbi:quinone-dependent dihydroorotate dehydrogenase [Sediminitomix flava]|uniref:Dihydroorotate dehydrogenase (quinone) n=1 Tax=Sediminitomix flava TaxID=379075 RepID=A0A315ZA15_SEDFL|nr:quinone-dependent dihydroorotate dehydrogenase [Sediminitomix flava]PWJ42019.1 dihydroorotate oxidase A [Sediminitomix flava]